MDTLYEIFIAPLGQAYFQKALIGGGTVGLVCGVIGCLVILRRMAFLGDALSHAMLAGVAGGYLFMKVLFGVEAHAPAMLIGSILAAIVTVMLIGFVSKVSRIKEDSAIGIMYCGIFAAGVVLTSLFSGYVHIDLMHFIMGDVLGISDADLWISVFVAASVLTVILLFFRQFQITSFDPVMAASLGLPVLLLDYVFTTCVSMVVVAGVGMVGVILVIGLLITPAATAYLLTDRLERMMALAGLFGVTSVIGGLYLSVAIDSAGGGAIVVFSTLQFLVALVFAPRYGLMAGWLRRRRFVPQEYTEDVLKAVFKAPNGRLFPRELRAAVAHPGAAVARALERLEADGLMQREAGALLLTDTGEREARRVVRAHRIWETYLRRMGTPAEELHDRAERLEHLDDDWSVDYLDHRLGHPLEDPHGSAIPRPEAMHVSSMPPGLGAVITDIAPAVAAATGLAAGDAITLAERCDNAETFTVEPGAAPPIQLTHDEADAIRVRPEG
jgi:manganese/iron transport system permease protein/iron/zinc/copper transport system permease protein